MTIRIGPILVVEDIAHIRELIALQLKTRGYIVITANDGFEALERIRHDQPSVIITDILMPRMDGFTLAHQLRTNPLTAHIPFIFLSGTYISSEDARFAVELGALRFLPKPINTDELFIVVADALTGQASPANENSIPDEVFYQGYRQRLESKFLQKSQQIRRNERLIQSAAPEQRDTYRHLLSEAQAQFLEIERELTVLDRLAFAA